MNRRDLLKSLVALPLVGRLFQEKEAGEGAGPRPTGIQMAIRDELDLKEALGAICPLCERPLERGLALVDWGDERTSYRQAVHLHGESLCEHPSIGTEEVWRYREQLLKRREMEVRAEVHEYLDWHRGDGGGRPYLNLRAPKIADIDALLEKLT